jgi:cytochrome c
MRAHLGLLLVTGAALTLAACGQKGGAASTSPVDQGPPPAMAEPEDPAAKAMVATLPAPFNTGDPVNGKAVFARCRACHTTEKGGPNMTGPNLWGVFGRKAASKSDYGYSDALKTQTYAWDAQHLDAWITSPRTVAPGTKMTFIGLDDPKDRRDVIAYLKTATEAKPDAAVAKPDDKKK